MNCLLCFVFPSLFYIGVIFCQNGDSPATTPSPAGGDVGDNGPFGTLQIELLKLGSKVGCYHSRSGDTVHIKYVGTLENGEVFDSSEKEGSPFTFELGSGNAIPCMDVGVTNMCEGSIRKLTCSLLWGYGSAGYKDKGKYIIPPNATIIFNAEMLKIDPAGGGAATTDPPPTDASATTDASTPQ